MLLANFGSPGICMAIRNSPTAISIKVWTLMKGMNMLSSITSPLLLNSGAMKTSASNYEEGTSWSSKVPY